MARIKAFHSVSNWAMEDILQDGAIRPRIERMNPAYWAEECDHWLDELMMDIDWGDIAGSFESLEAVREIVSDRLQDVESPEQAGGGDTEFQCLDLMAGDFKSVFLQVGAWPKWMKRGQVGFSFDAVELIRHGALLRRKDIIRHYHLVVERALRTWVIPDTVRAAKKRILDGLARVHDRYTHSGSHAIRILAEVVASGKAELLYPGPLPIEEALEVFS